MSRGRWYFNCLKMTLTNGPLQFDSWCIYLVLILEYVEKGALNMYLRKFRKQNTYLPVWRLMKMISDVAQVGIVAESGHHLKCVKWFTIEWNKTEAIFPIAQTFALLQHHLWLSFKTSQNALIWYDNVEPDKEILGCSFKHGCNVFFLQKWLVVW